MNAIRDERDLIDLLRCADAEAPPLTLPPAKALVSAARDAAVARDRLHLTLTGSALVLALVASVAFSVARSDLHRRRISDADRARLRNELSMLNHHAESGEMSANRMSQRLQRRKQAQQRAQLFQKPTALEQVIIDRDRTAMTLYLDAREMEQKATRPQVARSQFRRIISLFPDSPAAELARRRLAPDTAAPKDKDHAYHGSM